MPKCKNDPTKNYKGDEPSPKGLGYCAHVCNLYDVMKGKDGKEWIVKQDKRGVKKWIVNNQIYLFVFFENKTDKWPKQLRVKENKKPTSWKFSMSDWTFDWMRKIGYNTEHSWVGSKKDKKEMIKYLKEYYKEAYKKDYISNKIMILEKYPHTNSDLKNTIKYNFK